MLGMSFASFLVLLVIAVVVSVLFHFVLRYRFLEGTDAFFGKTALAWVGGWLGSPVLGHWLWKVDNVYVVPAILGAGVAVFLSVLGWKAVAKACVGRPAA